MPACEKGTCSGHRADDLLPWGDFLDEGETYTNYGFYEFMSPENDDFPYVYDSLTEWPGCEAQGIYFGQSGSDDGSSVVTSNSATDDMSGDMPIETTSTAPGGAASATTATTAAPDAAPSARHCRLHRRSARRCRLHRRSARRSERRRA